MTVQSDLKTALETYINSNFSGELAAVSAEQLNLERLLKILESVTPVTLSGNVTIDNVAITSSALPDGAATSLLQSAVQADAGADAIKAIAVQGVTGGKSVPVVFSGALPAGSNVIGSIANTSFGISGTLPPFAATPTFNLGTAPTVTTQGTGYLSSVAITRPSDTSNYLAGTVLGSNSGSAIIEFTNMGAAGRDTYITDVRLRFDTATIPSGMTSFRLHLYSAAPAAIADRGTWDLGSGDRATYLGFIDLGSIADLGSTLYLQAENLNIRRRLTSTSIFGLLVTNGAWTPTSGLVSNISMGGIAI